MIPTTAQIIGLKRIKALRTRIAESRVGRAMAEAEQSDQARQEASQRVEALQVKVDRMLRRDPDEPLIYSTFESFFMAHVLERAECEARLAEAKDSHQRANLAFVVSQRMLARSRSALNKSVHAADAFDESASSHLVRLLAAEEDVAEENLNDIAVLGGQ